MAAVMVTAGADLIRVQGGTRLAGEVTANAAEVISSAGACGRLA